MVANEVTNQIVTRKDINSFRDLLSELSELLLPFGINIKMKPLGGRQFFTFTYTVPFAQSQLKFTDSVAAAIGFHGSSTKYQENGMINEMTSLGVPSLKMYDELCKITYIESVLDLQGLKISSYIRPEQKREGNATAFWGSIRTKTSVSESELEVTNNTTSKVTYEIELENRTLQKEMSVDIRNC